MTDPFSPFPFVSRTLCGWASVVGLVAVFITDWFTPLGFGHGMLYSPLILLALVSGSRALVLGVALCAILFTLIGMLMSPDAPDIPTINTVFANRVLSILLIVFTTGLSLWLLINVQRLNSATEKLMATQQRLSEQHHLLRIASQVGHLGGWTVTVPAE
jgi:hypothetical protein